MTIVNELHRQPNESIYDFLVRRQKLINEMAQTSHQPQTHPNIDSAMSERAEMETPLAWWIIENEDGTYTLQHMGKKQKCPMLEMHETRFGA